MKFGYKVFYKGLINRYGEKFEIGKQYEVDDKIKWGECGFHFCTHLEDCFRYIDTFNYDVDVAIVKGFGNMIEYFDEYYDYDNMYVCEKMEIISVLDRSEIISIMLSSSPRAKLRFLRDFNLTEDEKTLFDVKVLKKLCQDFRY